MTPCQKLGYKVGDRFTVLVDQAVGFSIGQIVTLYEDDGSDSPLFQGDNDTFKCCDYQPGAYTSLDSVKKIVKAATETPLETPCVEDTSNHHVHHDLIIAWAKGEKIQYFSCNIEEWIDTDAPKWDFSVKYRIKPDPKPDVVFDKHCFITEDADNAYTVLPDESNPANVRFIFDGETRELKDVEFLGE